MIVQEELLKVEVLFCEELMDVGEGPELQSVSCGIEEGHGGLFVDSLLKRMRF